MGVLEILGAWVSTPPPPPGGACLILWGLMGSRQGCIRVGACVPCLVLHILCPILLHASLTENDAGVAMWVCCKYKSQLNTGGH